MGPSRFRLASLAAAAALALGPGCGGDLPSTNLDIVEDVGGDLESDAEAASDADTDRGTDDAEPDADVEESADGQACPDGWQDHDGDGVCRPGCVVSGLTCSGRSHCEDSSGTVACACDEGTQDHDGNGSCLPTCDTAGLDCGGHGTCDDAGGIAACSCLAGYVGERCDTCSSDYQDHDGDGSCLPDCDLADPDCGSHAACDDSSGLASCLCAPGYSGDGCVECAAGFQDNDGDGSCLPDCATAAPDCTGAGRCADTSGMAVCVCDPGFQDHDHDGDCREDCTTAAPACPIHAACDDSRGDADCSCEAGYQDHDGDGACLEDCSLAGLTCDVRRHCDDASGTAQCACDRGYEGDDCTSCAAGFVDSFGVCRPDHAWTFLVYLNGDNDLEASAWEDLEELADAGSSAEIHVVVLFDSRSGGGSVRYVRPGVAEIVSDWGEPDMGDFRTLRDFGAWAVRSYPAERYALILWDHGSGWKSAPDVAPPAAKSFSVDEHGTAGGISISNGDLALALHGITDALDGRRLDLVGFDACLMGMWEVAEAVAPYARYLLASSENEPLSGWPYRGVLRDLRAHPSMDPEALGTAMVDAYVAASPLHFTLAVTDLEAVAAVGDALSGLADAFLEHRELHPALESARREAQAFGGTDVRDLQDLAERIAAGSPPADVAAAADLVVGAVRTAVVYQRAQPSHPGAHGLSVYVPGLDRGMDCAYAVGLGATWSARTRWDELLVDFTGSACPRVGAP